MEQFVGPPPRPYYQEIHTSLADLVRGAIEVGARPVGLGIPPRPLMEVCWRAAMIAANLEQGGGRWIRSASYDRLDPSEKSAVSYFMGMTQAEVVCEKLNLASHLVHVDAVRSVVFGTAGGRTRPDLVGVDAGLSYSILVEAKGRSGGWKQDVIDKAKAQATALTPIVPMTPIRVASLAYFGTHGWCSWLVDPEGDSDIPTAPFTLEVVLIAYYRPLVAALLTTGLVEGAGSIPDFQSSPLPGMDMTLSLPGSIIEVLQDVPLAAALGDDVIARSGGALVDALGELSQALSVETLEALRAPVLRPSGGNETVSVGFDGVRVELGPSWYQTAQATQ